MTPNASRITGHLWGDSNGQRWIMNPSTGYSHEDVNMVLLYVLVISNKLLTKHSSCRYLDVPCRSCDVTKEIDVFIHYQKQLPNIWNTQLQYSHLIFWFTGNGLAPNTNKYCDLNATLTCSVMDEKCNLQCPKLKTNYRMYRNVSLF